MHGTSQDREVSFQLVLGDVDAVLIPFDLLVRNEFLEDMISQGFSHQFTVFGVMNRVV